MSKQPSIKSIERALLKTLKGISSISKIEKRYRNANIDEAITEIAGELNKAIEEESEKETESTKIIKENG